jgi:hypothetical protein
MNKCLTTTSGFILLLCCFLQCSDAQNEIKNQLANIQIILTLQFVGSYSRKCEHIYFCGVARRCPAQMFILRNLSKWAKVSMKSNLVSGKDKPCECPWKVPQNFPQYSGEIRENIISEICVENSKEKFSRMPWKCFIFYNCRLRD